MSTRRKLPRIPGHAGRLFKRSSFLSPTNDGRRIRAFFGPGQRPDAIDTYTPPTDWPGAGTLLRPPQVVWLSGMARPLFWQAPFVAGERTPAVQFSPVAEKVVRTINPEFATGEGFSAPGQTPWYFASVPNQDLIDYREMQELLTGVADRIGGVRAGRTWVYNVDWLTWDAAGDDATVFRPYSGVGDTVEHFARRYLVTSGSGSLHLWTPPDSDDGAYFGTDFLNVFMGLPWTYSGRNLSAYEPTVASDPLAFNSYTQARDGIKANASRFSRYAVRAYGNSQEWDQYPQWPTWGERFAGDVSGTYNQSTALTNAFNANLSVNGNNFLRATCEDVSAKVPGADVQYMGLRNGLAVDDIVTMIADHYGFDPDTGKDVG